MGFVRKHLSTDGLLNIVKHGLRYEIFPICKNVEYSWQDCIMSGLAVFGFKQASSDTCMRERLDQVLPWQLRRAYKKYSPTCSEEKL